MPAISLNRYIWEKEGVRISDLRSDKPSPSPFKENPVSSWRRLSLPENSIHSLANLESVFQSNPKFYLCSSLDKLTSELLDLEKLYRVALLNPAVTDAGRLARESWKRAEALWSRDLLRGGDRHAQRAVMHGIKSLVAAYQTTSADKIVEARKYIENTKWLAHPESLIVIHRRARTFYELGRGSQVKSESDRARLLFKKAILDIQQLYLESERLTHLMSR